MLETTCIALAKDLLRLSTHPDGSQLSVTPAPWRLILLASEGTRTAVHTPHIYTQFKQTKIQLQCHAEETSLQTGVCGGEIQETSKQNRLLPLSLVVSQNLKVSLSYGRHHKPQTQDLEEASWQPPPWGLALSIRRHNASCQGRKAIQSGWASYKLCQWPAELEVPNGAVVAIWRVTNSRLTGFMDH